MRNVILILGLFLSSLISAQEKAKSIFDIARSGTVAEVQELMKQNPDIINQNRRLRIAKGSGTNLQEVNKLIKQFDDMRKVMKQFSNPAAAAKMMRNMPKMPTGKR